MGAWRNDMSAQRCFNHLTRNLFFALWLAVALSMSGLVLMDLITIPDIGHFSALLKSVDPEVDLSYDRPLIITADSRRILRRYKNLDLVAITSRIRGKAEARLRKSEYYQRRLNATASETHGYLSHGINDGGLGNWLFMVASLYGIARVNLRTPSLFQTYWAETYLENFNLTRINRTDFFLGGNYTEEVQKHLVPEASYGTFAAWMVYLDTLEAAKHGPDMVIQGYLQSWMYFHWVRDEIRSMFTFKRIIYDACIGAVWYKLNALRNLTVEMEAQEHASKAEKLAFELDSPIDEIEPDIESGVDSRTLISKSVPKFVDDGVAESSLTLTKQRKVGSDGRRLRHFRELLNFDASSGFSAARERARKEPVLVGIHVRRGDIANRSGSHYQFGHTPATDDYLLHAVAYFERKYPLVIFFVVSNDIAYCRKLFLNPNVLYLEKSHEAVDMAFLSLMDNIILTVGSYGWWAAYLSDADEVLYYKDWPRPGSEMARGINPKQYFLGRWKPMV
ncbi:hypothetical protein RvY_04860 [Ramazzottius varieornatus]|uniref:L-Fucosyltransferase n=1 Tax=Ramazzottius varieornatus TaxID=947166 RepID=A0A1D1V2Z2_RAMVA|nr:hypothetical protein RvY_04860 [Ramazzottius varieornatus]